MNTDRRNRHGVSTPHKSVFRPQSVSIRVHPWFLSYSIAAACAALLLWCAVTAADIVLYDQAPAADAAYFPGTKVTAQQPTPAGNRQLLELQGYVCSTHPLLQDLYDVEVTALVRARSIDKQRDYNFRGVGVAARYQPYRQMVESWLYFQTVDRAVAEKAWDIGNGCVTTAHFGTDFKLAFVDSRMYRGGATELKALTSQAPGLETGKWYYYKLRLDGDDQLAKVWAAGSPEPDYQVVFKGIESGSGGVGFRTVGATKIEIANLRVTWLGATADDRNSAAARIATLQDRLQSLDRYLSKTESTISLASTADRFTAHYRMVQLAAESARRLTRAKVTPIAGDLTRVKAALDTANTMRHRLAAEKDPYTGITGFMERAYRSEVDGTLQPYALYVPPGYSPGKAWPMIVMLHGTSGNTRIQLVHAGLQAPGRKFPYVVIGPGGRGPSAGYNRFGEVDVWDAMADVQSRYTIDENRVYLTGLSLGGDGTVMLSYVRPDKFAAVAPFGIGVSKWRTPNFWNLPIRFGMTDQEGAKDDAEYRQLLANDGLPNAFGVVYPRKDYPETATFGQKPAHFHASTVPDYRLGRVFDFFAQHRRDPFPKKVAYENQANRLGRYYWFEVELVTLLHGKWRVEIEVGDDNLIQLRTWHVARMKLFLNDQLVDMQRPVKVTNNGTPVYDGPAKDTLELALAKPPTSKLWKGRPGTYGSFLDFFNYPVVYVYGTVGTAGETEQLLHEAQLAAGWEGQVHVDFPVIPEERVTGKMMQNHNLVLFGTPSTSMLLKRLLPDLPLELTATGLTLAGKRHEGENIGVKMLYPNPLAPGRMVQVVTGSGMPALKDSAFVAEHAAKTYYKQAWLGEDFIVFDDAVKAFQRAVRADRKHPFAHHVKFRKEVRRVLRDYGIFAMDWVEIDSRKGMDGGE